MLLYTVSLISSSVTETLKFLQAGEVLWSPQKEEDTLIDHKLFKDYPELSKCMFDYSKFGYKNESKVN
jgi:uncharacterized membrane protein